ncbi:DUF2798 domain-containing protein [Paucibacter soli]|uniref:DUF2798 domain-containing protein n=1 Tax=Paucibacter soli TaxID=3133433 RepID=UPI003095E3B4
MLPRKLVPLLFGFIVSGLMSALVSGISTLRMVGLGPTLWGLWLHNWGAAWALAFPAVLLVAPLAQRLVKRLVAPA